MSELPTGTVSLLFSDIEGSTLLLSRLDAAYADALDGQRQVLRKAWADHGGTELGTEGDSFFVVFPTAEGAVRAATQAQRDLAGFAWPAGEQVKVRMGIHTGSPTIHDGGYVGMDVHRAARIAGASHGGQVVLSEVTAKLLGSGVGDGVTLKDLGSHQLKDIAEPEHLFQLVMAGLPSEFGQLKTLGTSSSLPVQATPLVGRNGELAELSALLASPQVRLLTLTGPGGSGKTRLAIGLTERLVERFPDGVYFVDLAAVTTTDVMWTTIAETLDVPPEGRIPPGFFSHVAHRSALFVLDNLEQVDGADAVADQLLREAPQVVVVATSRRPLRVPAEHEHPVPPLELPEEDEVDAAASGAVQLFVQQARKVRPNFSLTADNAADVVAICRGLDGLPLAIELAAARSKLLSPHALLTRLDTALDLKISAVGRPTRQQTLRETIAWSYELLTEQQQAFFRRLGVFAGGADLDAMAAVCDDILDNEDPLDLVAELVDANLATVTDDDFGEPRIGMLVTVRAYAREQLQVAGEAGAIARKHAEHYVALLEGLNLNSWGVTRAWVAARGTLEREHDNFREALGWALIAEPAIPGAGSAADDDKARLGGRLCAQLGGFWTFGGYLEEGRRWLELALTSSSRSEDRDRAAALAHLSRIYRDLGDYEQARRVSAESVELSREIRDVSTIVDALYAHHVACLLLRDFATAREALSEALSLVEGEGGLLHTRLLICQAAFLCESGELDESLRVNEQVLRQAVALHEPLLSTIAAANLADVLLIAGQTEQAHVHLRSLVEEVIACRIPAFLINFAETYSGVLIELGHVTLGAELLGACAAMRERTQIHREVEDYVERAKEHGISHIGELHWEREYNHGRLRSMEELLWQAREVESVGERDLTKTGPL